MHSKRGAVDDMVLLAKQFIQCQQEFQQNGIDATVTLAYHYTKDQNMDSIQQDGLMMVADRDRNGIRTRQKGAYYGDGVYTATNPYAFQKSFTCRARSPSAILKSLIFTCSDTSL
jgi:hypothetical protein